MGLQCSQHVHAAAKKKGPLGIRKYYNTCISEVKRLPALLHSSRTEEEKKRQMIGVLPVHRLMVAQKATGLAAQVGEKAHCVIVTLVFCSPRELEEDSTVIRMD